MENTSPFKILIIDDNADNIMVLSEILVAHNFEVLVATSGEKGIVRAREVEPDLILLDIMMPVLNGYETCLKLKANASTKDIPVIFLSALSDSIDKIKAFNTGGVDYITKPIQIDELLVRISTHLSISNLQKKLEEANKSLEKRVKERTIQLNETNKQLKAEIKQRKLAEKRTFNAIIEAEEKERSNFAREMHDSVGQLSIIKMYLNELARDEYEKDKSADILQKTIDLLEGAINSVVEISHAMSPNVLRKYGISHAIESFCKKIQFENTPEFHFDLQVTEKLESNLEFNLYRITTELINNTLKYAKAKNIELRLVIENRKLIFEYKDDGIGFDEKKIIAKQQGLGLTNIINRANSHNGKISIKSRPNNGMSAKICIPFTLKPETPKSE